MEKPYTGLGKELKQMVVEFLKKFIYHSPSSQRSAYSPTVYPPTIRPPVLLPIHLYTIYPSIDLPTYPFSIPDIHQLSINLLTRPSFFCPSIYHPPSRRPTIHPPIPQSTTHLLIYPSFTQPFFTNPLSAHLPLIYLTAYLSASLAIHPFTILSTHHLSTNLQTIHQHTLRSTSHPLTTHLYLSMHPPTIHHTLVLFNAIPLWPKNIIA